MNSFHGSRNNLLNILCKIYPERTRQELLIFILMGNVYVNSHKERNPKILINKVSRIDLVNINVQKFVSRGGSKLLEAIESFGINVKGKICVDVGSSTGGFTDCLLQRGASIVYAVDVGINQLDYKLRKDPRVRVLEKTNIFNIEKFSSVPNFAVIDVSFRSSISVCSSLINKLSEHFIIVLIKPQFEFNNLGIEIKDFKGIVDNKYLKKILVKVIDKFYKNKLQVNNILKLNTKGRKGNQEFMFLVVKDNDICFEHSILKLNDIEF